ncbi:hypothetical protein EVAR_55979_1 [Eumeta japonica]|uniref:Uncharacterized protein n=1 Tax=Eumeta variegata TaxID=151549 RepID=A0A4C1Y8G8_EUMVA|nr:hypothetical protein EVAR_55979_1 [Eumeta japonica]
MLRCSCSQRISELTLKHVQKPTGILKSNDYLIEQRELDTKRFVKQVFFQRYYIMILAPFENAALGGCPPRSGADSRVTPHRRALEFLQISVVLQNKLFDFRRLRAVKMMDLPRSEGALYKSPRTLTGYAIGVTFGGSINRRYKTFLCAVLLAFVLRGSNIQGKAPFVENGITVSEIRNGTEAETETEKRELGLEPR